MGFTYHSLCVVNRVSRYEAVLRRSFAILCTEPINLLPRQRSLSGSTKFTSTAEIPTEETFRDNSTTNPLPKDEVDSVAPGQRGEPEPEQETETGTEGNVMRLPGP